MAVVPGVEGVLALEEISAEARKVDHAEGAHIEAGNGAVFGPLFRFGVRHAAHVCEGRDGAEFGGDVWGAHSRVSFSISTESAHSRDVEVRDSSWFRSMLRLLVATT